MSALEHLTLDQATLAAARDGDMAACEAIYRRFEKPVYSLAYRLCAHREEAMEVMQDTFIHAFGKLHQFRGDSPFWPWLRRVAVTQSLMRLRRERLHRFWPARAPRPDEHTPDRTGEGLDLSAALARLPRTARAVVWLHDVEGYTHGEIAALMGRTESFSKTQLSRARARLRAWLDPEAEGSPCEVMIRS